MQEPDVITPAPTALAEPQPARPAPLTTSAGAMIVFESVTKVYEPDVKAFREHAQKAYLASDIAKSWPKGMLEKINAIQ